MKIRNKNINIIPLNYYFLAAVFDYFEKLTVPILIASKVILKY